MKRTIAIAMAAGLILWVCGIAAAGTLAGSWTKTTHPDPHNIVLLYSDANVVKATGYEQVGGAPAYWHGEGTLRDGKLHLWYHYSPEATPRGWEPDGRMLLKLSEDGNTLSGVATSRSGNWSDRIELRRITFVMQQ